MVTMLTLASTREWLAGRGLLDSNGSLRLSEMTCEGTHRIPPDSGRKTALSRLIVSMIFESDESCLLWIDEYGIWPSSEDLVLFHGFRQSLGEGAAIGEKPGHLSARSDAPQLQALVSMALYFSWGAFLVAATGRVIIRVSHDEMVDVYVRRPYEISDIALATLEDLTRV